MKNTERESHIECATRDRADRVQVERRGFERGAQTVDSLGSQRDRGILGVDVYTRRLCAAVRKEKRKVTERRAEVVKAKAPPR
jgi:hypothetical protein